MNTISPFSARVGLSRRSSHLVDLILRNNPMVTDYRLWVSRSLNDAYGTVVDSGLTGTGGTMIMEAHTNRMALSPKIVLNGQASVAEVRRGQTSFMFDVDDYIAPAGNVPSDSEYLFARVQEKRLALGWAAVDALAVKNANMPIRGSILVVPDPGFYGHAASVFSLAGTAPAGSDCTAGSPPVIDQTVQKPMPMHIIFPRPMGSLTVRNTSAASTLLVSFGLGQPMVEVGFGQSILPTGGGFSLPGVGELIVAMEGAGAGCAFSLDGVIGHQW
jgi:hypothetical protein